MILEKLRKFHQSVLRREVPPALFSWRFLAPNQDARVRLHRKVFFNARGRFPHWAWALIWVYSSLTWYFWHGWKQTMRVYGRFSQKMQSLHGVSRRKQIAGLLNLVFLHAIPPVYYYRYGLFLPERRNPFAYIYTHELPHWHHVMCGDEDTDDAVLLLGDKKEFATRMSVFGIPVIPTYASCAKGVKLRPELFFTGKSLFLKPRNGSQMKGCFALRYCPDREEEYVLGGEEKIEGKDAVYEYIQKQVAKIDYLVQPLLVNHPEMEGIAKPTGLIIIRVITGHDGKQPVTVSAIIEIPMDDGKNWALRHIDCESGEIIEKEGYLDFAEPEETKESNTSLTGKILPKWPEVIGVCIRAHEHFSGIPAIGWDVAITDRGAVLIEGNFNWRVQEEQTPPKAPLLNSRLMDVYQSRQGMGSV